MKTIQKSIAFFFLLVVSCFSVSIVNAAEIKKIIIVPGVLQSIKEFPDGTLEIGCNSEPEICYSETVIVHEGNRTTLEQIVTNEGVMVINRELISKESSVIGETTYHRYITR